MTRTVLEVLMVSGQLLADVELEMAKMEGEFNELYKEYKERVKDTENLLIKNDDPVFNVKMVNNTVTWLVKAMNDVVDKTKKKFEGWKNEFSQSKKV